MSRGGFGDLVNMPLPNQWGATVIPPGANATTTTLPTGATLGWQQVPGGWILAVRHRNGNVQAYPGATVVPYPGAQSQPLGNGSGSNSPETAAYFGGDPGSSAGTGGNPSSPQGAEYWNKYPGGGLPQYSGGLMVRGPANAGQPRGSWPEGPGAPSFRNGPGGNSGNGWKGNPEGWAGPEGAYRSTDPGAAGSVGGNPAQDPGSAYWNPYSSGVPNGTDPVPNPGAPTWGRQPVLPDSMLPPALQRSNPLLRHQVYRANGYDMAIAQDAKRWGWIKANGGLKSCCRIPEMGEPIWDKPPWMVQPSQGEKFEEMFSLPTAGFTPGVDTILGQFTVPNGYDGALNRVVVATSTAGFIDFTGMIFWRVQVNNRYARNLGNIQNTFGSFQAAFSVPGTDNIRLVSQQTITLIANVPAGSPVAGGQISAGAFGWFYPRR
jgi:hypothetical protein